MRKFLISTVTLVTAISFGACRTDSQPAAQPSLPTIQTGMGAAAAGAPGAAMITGKVLETMTSGGYTYVHVDDGSKKIWAAAPQTTIAVDDQVSVPPGAPMKNFESKTLGRTFELVYFVSGLQKAGGNAAGVAPAVGAATSPQMAAAHGGSRGASVAAIVDVSGISKAKDGQTVAELFAKSSELAGKPVVVRGKVAKYSAGIMGKNWIHLQDGTGSAGTNDLTVTTAGTAAVGNTVLVRGNLTTNKDFGFGYKYDVMIEDAAVTVE